MATPTDILADLNTGIIGDNRRSGQLSRVGIGSFRSGRQLRDIDLLVGAQGRDRHDLAAARNRRNRPQPIGRGKRLLISAVAHLPHRGAGRESELIGDRPHTGDLMNVSGDRLAVALGLQFTTKPDITVTVGNLDVILRECLAQTFGDPVGF